MYKKMEVEEHLLMVARFVNEIYGEVFGWDFISRLEKNAVHSWMETDITSSFSLNENGFILELMIPWVFLDIDVLRDKVIQINYK